MNITIAECKTAVALNYDISVKDLEGPARIRQYAWPRQVVAYLAKRHTSASLPRIGKLLGGRDHSTIMHGVRSVKNRMAGDREYCEEVEMISSALVRMAQPVPFIRHGQFNFKSRRTAI